MVGTFKYVTVLSNEHHLSPFLDVYQSTGVFSTLSLDPRKCSCSAHAGSQGSSHVILIHDSNIFRISYNLEYRID